MNVIEKKENFVKIAVSEGEKISLGSNGKIALEFISPNDCIIMLYRKIETQPLQFV